MELTLLRRSRANVRSSLDDSGSGKTMLFRAIAGLWPWGSGQIALPSSNSVTFVPRHPYVPLGTLREALAYPSNETAYPDEQKIAALPSAGLNRLSSSLDRIARWILEKKHTRLWRVASGVERALLYLRLKLLNRFTATFANGPF